MASSASQVSPVSPRNNVFFPDLNVPNKIGGDDISDIFGAIIQSTRSIMSHSRIFCAFFRLFIFSTARPYNLCGNLGLTVTGEVCAHSI